MYSSEKGRNTFSAELIKKIAPNKIGICMMHANLTNTPITSKNPPSKWANTI